MSIKEGYNTRFCPTLSAEGLHIGHLVSLYCNLFTALGSGGNFYTIAEGGSLASEDAVDDVKNLINIIVPSCDFINVPILFKDDIDNFLKENNFNIEIYSINHVSLLIQDYCQNINCIIRGDDWISNPLRYLSEVNYRMMVPECFFSFHPLMASNPKSLRKMSKSLDGNSYSIRKYLDKGVSMLGFLSYIFWASQEIEIDDVLRFISKVDHRKMMLALINTKFIEPFRESDLLFLNKEITRNFDRQLDSLYLDWIGVKNDKKHDTL